MMLFHRNCRWQTRLKRWLRRILHLRFVLRGDVSRLRLEKQRDIDIVMSIRYYRCEVCDVLIAIDMDFEEGAQVEPTATFS